MITFSSFIRSSIMKSRFFSGSVICSTFLRKMRHSTDSEAPNIASVSYSIMAFLSDSWKRAMYWRY